MKKLFLIVILAILSICYYRKSIGFNFGPFTSTVTRTIFTPTVAEKISATYQKKLSDFVWYLLGKAFTGLKPQLEIAQQKGTEIEYAGKMARLLGYSFLGMSSYNLILKFLAYRKKCQELDGEIKKLESKQSSNTTETAALIGQPTTTETTKEVATKEKIKKLKAKQQKQKSYLDKLATPILIVLMSTGFLSYGHGISITGNWLWWLPEQFLKWRR